MKKIIFLTFLLSSLFTTAQSNSRYTITHLNINTNDADFSPIYFRDQIVFASSRATVQPVKRVWIQNNLPFFDLYQAYKDQDGQLTKVKAFEKPACFTPNKLNRKWNDGPASFNRSCDYMAFTQNQMEIDGVKRLRIVTSELVNDRWSEPKGLYFDNVSFNAGHPALSPDGNTMYFASDMPGGLGGVDIYKSTRRTDGTWSTPVNAGPSVNSPNNDMFPFVHEDNLLFFASDRPGGKGGMDIYVGFITGGISLVERLESPINTEADDFGFILSDDQKSGYFSSNREGGKGNDDIYYFVNNKKFTSSGRVSGIVTDQFGAPLSETKIDLVNANGIVTGTTITASDGSYSFDIDPKGTYTLKAARTSYMPRTESVKGAGDGVEVTKNISLEKEASMSLFGKLTEKTSGEPIKNAKVTLIDNLSGKQEIFTTDENGTFLKALSDKKLRDRVSYQIKMEAQGYLSNSITYNKLLDRDGQYDVHAEAELKLKLISAGISKLEDFIDVKPIFFDIGKSDIRPDAAKELDKIVQVMNDNPTIEVELGAHTDSRGDAAKNLTLSQERATSSANYIKARITNPDRIFGKGYGETQLKNRCSDGVQCSEQEHSANRRTEFKIVKN